MKLKQLCIDLSDVTIRPFKDVEVSGITTNSKLVVPNSLFIAKRGFKNDGSTFILEAISNGASVIVSDVFDPTLTKVVQVICPNISKIEAIIAARFYGKPSDDLFMVGVTGTCGKTTTSYVIKHLLDMTKMPCGLIGTIEYRVGKKSYMATLTTPDVCANQKLLKEMLTQGCKACVMEVSSHALDQGRVQEIEFDIAVFTNLTHEHLDYHKTMDEYFRAKSMLFSSLTTTKESKKRNAPKFAIINADDPRKASCIQATAPTAKVITYGITETADIQAHDIQLGLNGTSFTVSYMGETSQFFWSLVGRFNVYNALAAIGVALARGNSLQDIAGHLLSFQTAQGRLDPVHNRLGVHILVDYAHKPEALRNVLTTLKEVATQKIIVLFGCGGDRDKEKRPIMGRIAEELADLVIVTSDNPRSENPEYIIGEILRGCKHPEKVIVIADRRAAINKAILLADPGDIVLIAGKGHETKQLFSHVFIDFDDKLIASECAEELYHKKILHMAGK